MVKEDGIEWTELTQIILEGNTMESPKKSRHILMTSAKDTRGTSLEFELQWIPCKGHNSHATRPH
jgi:hypothetical protein